MKWQYISNFIYELSPLFCNTFTNARSTKVPISKIWSYDHEETYPAYSTIIWELYYREVYLYVWLDVTGQYTTCKILTLWFICHNQAITPNNGCVGQNSRKQLHTWSNVTITCNKRESRCTCHEPQDYANTHCQGCWNNLINNVLLHVTWSSQFNSTCHLL